MEKRSVLRRKRRTAARTKRVIASLMVVAMLSVASMSALAFARDAGESAIPDRERPPVVVTPDRERPEGERPETGTPDRERPPVVVTPDRERPPVVTPVTPDRERPGVEQPEGCQSYDGRQPCNCAPVTDIVDPQLPKCCDNEDCTKHDREAGCGNASCCSVARPDRERPPVPPLDNPKPEEPAKPQVTKLDDTTADTDKIDVDEAKAGQPKTGPKTGQATNYFALSAVIAAVLAAVAGAGLLRTKEQS